MSDVYQWFKDRRGIDRETLDTFRIEPEGEGILIPYPDGAMKHRKTMEKIDNHHVMWFDPKAAYGQPVFLPPNFSSGGKTKIVFEGESDTMAAWQNAPSEIKPHIAGISGASAFGPRGIPEAKIQELFGDADRVFFVLDNEDPYSVADQSVATGRKYIKERLGRKAKFVRLPIGPQDACEFFMVYDWHAFKELLKQALDITYHYPALDFSKPVPEFDWLVENLLVKGDIALLNGDPGVGKSWIMLDLAVAMMTGRKWLGMDVEPGKVMFIDQENPMVTVRKRFEALGLPDDVACEMLRYLWYAGVRLDQEEAAARFYEDVEAFEPKLLVVDSLSRVHFRNENSAEEMNPLFNGGVFPIARNLGCTVGLIHHLSKQGQTRGSTAIKAAVDISLDMVDQERDDDKTGWQILIPDKLRNVAPWGASIHLQRIENEDGSITVQTEEEVSVI